MHHQQDSVLVGSIQKFSIEDGPGIRTTVFMKGCPLHCAWCHNPELIDPRQQLIQSPNNCIGCGCCIDACPRDALSRGAEGIVIDRDRCDACMACAEQCYARALRPVATEMTVDQIMSAVLQDEDFYLYTGGGLTLSGGEMLMHADVVRSIIQRAAEAGIGVCLDTCGMGDGTTLLELASHPAVTDVLYDMKAIDDEVHRRYTGRGNGTILENLRLLAASEQVKDKLTMRMPLVGGVNDGQDMIARTRALYGELGLQRVTLLPYHRLGIGKMRHIGGQPQEFEPPTEERLAEIARMFESLGMQVEILGRA